MADTKRLYRLSNYLSRNEESGRKRYAPGDKVRLTPVYAKRIGATPVDVYQDTEEGEQETQDRSLSKRSAAAPAGADSETDWSTLAGLSYEDAVALVTGADTLDELKAAREAEMGTGGKKRRSVIEAIAAKEKELKESEGGKR